MSAQPTRAPDPAPHPDSEQHARVAELESRIADLETLDEASFGAFTGWDWLACVLGAVVLPALALWWYAA